MEKVLVKAGFLNPSNPLLMMRDIRRIFNSADMDERDVTIIRGIFRKIGNLVRLTKEKNSSVAKTNSTMESSSVEHEKSDA
jgi:tRNA C32,U32 (ribose-2'-O)-methylase TrmJ